MLEQPSLRILAWSEVAASIAEEHPRGSAPPNREIVDPATGTSLGRALWSNSQTPGWLGWLFPRESSLGIYETEDDSLLMTLHGSGIWRLWPWRKRKSPLDEIGSESHWEVRDAEGSLVGRVERTGASPASAMFDDSGSANSRAAALGWDRHGRGLFLTDPQPGPVLRKFLGTLPQGAPSWIELGTLACDGGSVLVEFSDLVREEPFVKMLMLAMAIIANYKDKEEQEQEED
jgi:hypothetical protein